MARLGEEVVYVVMIYHRFYLILYDIHGELRARRLCGYSLSAA